MVWHDAVHVHVLKCDSTIAISTRMREKSGPVETGLTGPAAMALERAWYLLFAHARNYPLLNTCSHKMGGEREILIHVIGSVTYMYNLASILV